MSSASLIEPAVFRRYAGDQLLTLSKLVLETAFQPIVEVATGTVFGYETLMRGYDRIGFSDPLELLDQAAEAGQLLALEQMMAGRSLAKFATVPDFSSVTLFLNLDVRLIKDGDLIIERLVQHLGKLSIPPSSVCFELSERFDNTSVPEFAALITKLRKAGFKLAIDDFGVGHGEMKLLCDYQVDYLKIDRHFIDDMDKSPRKRHLVKNIVHIAHVLGTRVIAEGIETEAELMACREYGVDLVQGYFIARPTTILNELQPAFPHLAEIGRVRRSSQSLDEILIRKQIENLPAVYEHESIDTVFELFRRNPRQAFFPVLNANGEPRGVINEYHLKEYIYQPFGRDLLKNKVYERTISHFVDMAPIIGLDADAEELMSLFASMDNSDCIILTENMRYAGVVSAASLIKVISEKQLKIAQDQNPLTSLPGNRAISDFIQESGRDDDDPRFFCYCDFDHFKPFNDHYGFHVGDHAISLFAALLRRYFFSDDHFLGHVGGDDFFIGVRDWTREELTEILERLLSDFHDDVVTLYSQEEREAGRIKGHDRTGVERFFPLLRCSIGVLELPRGLLLDDGARIASSIAAVKAQAKDASTGLVFSVFGETN
ncbi:MULTISPECIES: bifunctional diguanylate cyclase/phosphodiesterase [Pseudorhizobium]|uniref:Diguanylate cyclase n=1 Tax=Pseudorhizobium pelagicum TaxID=1509405 RepID=A0A922NZ79_9HYPH|nr:MULTISPECIES: GGDEF domain-containing protein [Pseudorhizobium]MBA4785305.1 GGDEF domain-containing protein [Hyphomicrobiales bacterium]MBU1314358.1 GGDEF domain-containing protein [Alphaproteobacteria bacterium]KEQ05410.1 diguanylate cyclase [Pseudorhizobium pelagicum]KEQ06079.1 diguanylate cyclase [Pseudorhizobium pelagicum]MBU1552710.1 GGDEF domain-containing protein [Alphaproteobacteria bacterium]|tara:strand:+ start:406 stop:2211 length:1806 start_codon:yes stop_codon:yes gene_type:complete